MQISDEMIAFRNVFLRHEKALPDLKVAQEAVAAYVAALSLPVQPVAWPEGFFKLGGDNRLRECASDGCHQHVSIRVERGGVGSDRCEPCARKIADLITTPPAPPTNGPEDDLIAALRAMLATYGPPLDEIEYPPSHPVTLARAALALRSRPASALPVVGEATKCDGQLCYYHGCQSLPGCVLTPSVQP